MKKLAKYSLALILVLLLFKVNSAREIQFAGITWYVKNGGPMGPGPNYWSDSDQSVWVDSEGRLHLAVRKVSGRWYCAEVFSKDYTTHGEHRFLVEGQIDEMDKNLVLGLFLYANDHAEIDVEFAKWGSDDLENVGSFTVQTYTTENNSVNFPVELDYPYQSSHFFDWQPGYVLFNSMKGHYYDAPPSDKYYLKKWIYTGSDNPSESENLRTHINFWLMSGNYPQNLEVLEVIISDVVQPLSTGLATSDHTEANSSFELLQNIPNPFNSSTLINYLLPEASYVDLAVYNVLGKRVATLVSKQQKAGNYSVNFSASKLSSGIYLYKLQSTSFLSVKRMLYIK